MVSKSFAFTQNALFARQKMLEDCFKEIRILCLALDAEYNWWHAIDEDAMKSASDRPGDYDNSAWQELVSVMGDRRVLAAEAGARLRKVFSDLEMLKGGPEEPPPST